METYVLTVSREGQQGPAGDVSRTLKAYSREGEQPIFATDDVNDFCWMLSTDEQGSGRTSRNLRSGDESFSRIVSTPTGILTVHDFAPTSEMHLPDDLAAALRKTKPKDVMLWQKSGGGDVFTKASSGG